MLTKEEVVAYHDNLLSKNLKVMFGGKTDSDETPDRAVVTYSILKHAGMLYRYTADEDLFSIFPSDSVVTVAEHACEYIKEMTIVESLESILEEDFLSDYDIESAEALLYFRDGLEMVIFMLTRLAKPLIYEGNSALLDTLVKARSYALTFDEILRRRPDVYTVASRVGAYVKEYFKIKLNEADFWWFYEAIENDAKNCAFEEELARLLHRKALKKAVAKKIKKLCLAIQPEVALQGERYLRLNPQLIAATPSKHTPIAPQCEFSIDDRLKYYVISKGSGETKDIFFFVFSVKDDTLSYDFDGKSFVFSAEDNEWTSLITKGKAKFGSFDELSEISELMIEIKESDGTLYGTLFPKV